MRIESMYNEPVVYIRPIAYLKMLSYVEQADKEMGWLVIAFKEGDDYIIHDCIIPKQQVSAVTCEIDPEGIQNIMYELLAQDLDDYASSIKGWCHSHVDMPVNPSVQDDNQMYDFEEGNEWFIRGILNKKGDMKFDVFDYTNQLIYEDLDVKIEIPSDIIKETTKEIKDNVTEKKYKPVDKLHTDKLDVDEWDNYYYYKNMWRDSYDKTSF